MYQVTDITEAIGVADLPETISYNAAQQPIQISQEGTTGNTELAIQYGADQQRRYAELSGNGTSDYQRYYVGDFERNIKNGVIEDIHSIAPGVIIVGENNVYSEYYTYSDHLGSINVVTDDTGDVVARQSFDAWGRKRNATDWTYDNVDDYELSWLHRGYTGHEMLPEFGLINMNGRLYDNYIGRMLSPDQYAGLDGTSQGYNRYTYAYNNPLKYTDPTGEFNLFHAGIGAAIGSAVGYGLYKATGDKEYIAGGFALGAGIGGFGGDLGLFGGNNNAVSNVVRSVGNGIHNGGVQSADDIIIRLVAENGFSKELIRIVTDDIKYEIDIDLSDVYEHIPDDLPYTEINGDLIPNLKNVQGVSLNFTGEAAAEFVGLQFEFSYFEIVEGPAKGLSDFGFQVNYLAGLEASLSGTVGFYFPPKGVDLRIGDFAGFEIGGQAGAAYQGISAFSGFKFTNRFPFLKETYGGFSYGLSFGPPIPFNGSVYLGYNWLLKN